MVSATTKLGCVVIWRQINLIFKVKYGICYISLKNHIAHKGCELAIHDNDGNLLVTKVRLPDSDHGDFRQCAID